MSGTDQPTPGELTVLLNRMQKGDKAAGDRAVELVYDELHRMASRQMRFERGDGQLQATALIHEAYLRLAGAEGIEIRNRGHFFAIASRQMRRLLVDAARSAKSQKRGGPKIEISLSDLQIVDASRSGDLIELDEALGQLEQLDSRAVQVVELKFFGGHTDREIAEALGVALSTVRRDWDFARAWLFDRLSGQKDGLGK